MSVFILIFSLFLVVIHAIKPFSLGKHSINLGAFCLGVLLILFSFSYINFSSVEYGIIGDDNLQPWKIMIIFFTVAYCAISTDITGVFDVIAHRIVKISSGNAVMLFTLFYIFASFLTIFTSNDIVILTLTPIIFYLGKYTNLNILPFLFAEFFAANTLSMMLLIGNPTNIIISDALNFGFLEYLEIMILPTIVATILTYLLLYLYFRKDLSEKFKKLTNESMIPKNYINIGVSAILMLLMLYTLILSDFLNVEIWEITTLFFSLFLIQDIILSLYINKKNNIKKDLNLPTSKIPIIETIKGLPWNIAPLIFLLFIIIGELTQTNIFISLVEILVSWCTNIYSTVFSMGILSLISANIINNQPMSILFSSILLNFPENFSLDLLHAAGYSVIISSNLAANLTPLGALAGIMWLKILKSKEFKVSYLEFFKLGIIITPLVFLATILTLIFVLLTI
jgi:arsenical pump membrane protein